MISGSVISTSFGSSVTVAMAVAVTVVETANLASLCARAASTVNDSPPPKLCPVDWSDIVSIAPDVVAAADA